MSMIKGRKSKENNPSEVCCLCKRSLRFNYGDYKSMSCVNIFKPSTCQTSVGVIWEEELQKVGIYLESRTQETSRNWHATYAADRSAIFAHYLTLFVRDLHL